MQKWISSLLAFVTVFSASFSFSSSVNAQTEEEVEELAESLEFMFEEAVIKDETGKPIDMDYDKIQEELGVTDDEIEDMKADIEESEENSTACNCEVNTSFTMSFQATSTPYGPPGREAVSKCIEDKITDNWEDSLGINALATAISYILEGKYKSAAKKLINAGLKGNVASVAGQLGYYYAKCLWIAGDDPWNN